MSPPPARHQFWIDRGGTFTDCIHRDGLTGELRVIKVLSSDRAPVEGIRDLLGLGADDPIPAAEIRMGTTLATNALLERRGCACVLISDQGLGELVHIRDQTRPDLFALEITRPAALPVAIVEVGARMHSDGTVEGELDDASLIEALTQAKQRGARSVAIALIHSTVNAAIESRVAAVAAQLGFEHLSLSHEVSHERGLLGRTDTTVANAYLTPVLTGYLAELQRELAGSRVQMMQSHGGLVDAAQFIGRDAVLSGPAAGVVALGAIATELGRAEVIGFDMGGTSTDVSRYDGEFARVFESEVGGVRIRAPMIELHTVAAGGGSICEEWGGRLIVGPESAGADPGPLCYDRARAETLTLTDASLCLGRIVSDRFPFPLNDARPRSALNEVAERLKARGVALQPTEVAVGFLRVAVESMASAIRKVSVAQGHDVRTHSLVVFGGAGGQYAGLVARQLGIRELIFHPHAGVLSAFGMGVADFEWHGEHDTGHVALDDSDLQAWENAFSALRKTGQTVLAAHASSEARETIHHEVALRYQGTETALMVDFASPTAMREAFESQHRRQFGYHRPEHTVEASTLRTTVTLQTPAPTLPRASRGSGQPLRHGTLWSGGQLANAPVFARQDLPIDQDIAGPALVLDDTGTIVIEAGFVARRDERDYLIVQDRDPPPALASGHTSIDPVLLEVFNHRFTSIAEQMGVVLKRTALSTNIRDRLDFSCAVFDTNGGLVANAPHIPVHLGAMSESIRAVIADNPSMQPGDVFATNDPAAGGSHLPDVTVITPVHEGKGRPRFFVASRGHHADIGGVTPGSMPPFSTTLEEEGVVLRNLRIVRGGAFDEAQARSALGQGPYPARNPSENIADLQAQIAANETGAHLLKELTGRYGEPVVSAYMQHIQDNAAELTATAIGKLPDGDREFEDFMDDGMRIAVRVSIRGTTMHIDFGGTARSGDHNLNAPRAVTMSAVLYVVRVLVGQPIPLNGGCLRSVTVDIPDGSLLNPEPWRAVAAGNVETSQRIVDVLLGALGLAAASQGTMNNITFGTAELGYYETLGGGVGATPRSSGASGVHTHMTNSRCTDPEVLEARFPVVLRRFSLRHGSGGAGAQHGGDGLVRELQFLAPVRVSVISERRAVAPYGMQGGASGATGVNQLNRETLASRFSVDVSTGDVLRIETPGGGGWGAA